eukprot:SAG31_NODE_14210_length_820_cov_1.780860_1_plen_75_part_10
MTAYPVKFEVNFALARLQVPHTNVDQYVLAMGHCLQKAPKQVLDAICNLIAGQLTSLCDGRIVEFGYVHPARAAD